MSKDRADVVKYCLDHGTPVTPEVMKIILMNRTKDVYKLLLDTNAINVDCHIPLFGDMLSDAATNDDLKMATICLSHGADPNTNPVDEHLSILGAITDLASMGIPRSLLEHGSRLRGRCAIIKAAEAGKLEMVRVFLAEGADLNEVGIGHPTDLTYKYSDCIASGCRGGHEEIVKSLLAHGAATSTTHGRTPLALALD